jgi:hypothetical protein
MTPREGFGIILRTAGLGLLIHGARNLLFAIALGVSEARGLWLQIIVALLVGVWLLGGARILVAYAYPKDSA